MEKPHAQNNGLYIYSLFKERLNYSAKLEVPCRK